MEKQFLIAALCGLMLVSCGKQQEEEVAKDKGFDLYTLVSGTLSSDSEGNVFGSAIVRFNQEAPMVVGGRAFSFNANLETNGSAISLLAFSNQLNLTNGIQVRFERQGAGVLGTIQLNGETPRQIQSIFLGNVLPNALALVIEIHNGVGRPRIYVWREQDKPRTYANPIFDSEIANHLNLPLQASPGPGMYFGMRLENAKMSVARIKEPLTP